MGSGLACLLGICLFAGAAHAEDRRGEILALMHSAGTVLGDGFGMR